MTVARPLIGALAGLTPVSADGPAIIVKVPLPEPHIVLTVTVPLTAPTGIVTAMVPGRGLGSMVAGRLSTKDAGPPGALTP